MKKMWVSLCLLCGLFATGNAQQATDFKRTEFYVGYSNAQSEGNQNGNGFNVSGVYNVTRYIGIKGDVSATFNSQRFGFTNSAPFYTASFRSRTSLTNVLGGVQIKDNANSGRFKPFAHVLLGVGRTTSSSGDFQCSPGANCPAAFPTGSYKNTGFAGALGGGLDYRINKRIQVRLFQVDFNPVSTGFGTNKNVRLGAGIVF